MHRADVVICSAEYLKQTIINRSGVNRNVNVVNNATIYPSYNVSLTYRENFKFDSTKHSILYIGTIAKWFDFQSIISLLNHDANLICYLIGPLETELPEHNRIIHLGKCNHNEIWGIMKQADILAMPFVLNPLIESVNPVKLYEYIWAEKPIISLRYSETLKFKDFCHLYSSTEELISIYDQIVNRNYKPKEENTEIIKQFIKENTWESRCKEISDICFK